MKDTEQLLKLIHIGDDFLKHKKIQRFCEKRNLKKFLHQRCLSYRKLSNLVGISIDALNNKINGYTNFTTTEIIDFVIYFNLTSEQIAKLFFEEEKQHRMEILGDYHSGVASTTTEIPTYYPPF